MSTTKKVDPSAVPGIQTQTLEQSLRAKKVAPPAAPAPDLTSVPLDPAGASVATPSPDSLGTVMTVVHSAPPDRKRFKVLETVDIPRGASTFRLPKGKVVSSMGYDLAYLRACGAQLEEVPA